MRSFIIYLVFAIYLYMPRLLVSQNLVQYDDESLPNPDECGILKPDQLYNLEKLVQPDEFPWMAKLRYNTDGVSKYACLAELISRRFVIAPAHCFNYETPDAVVFGDCKEKCTNVTGISNIVKHPEYIHDEMANDIALIKFKRSIRYAYYMRPICLPSASFSEEGYVAHHLMSTGNVKFSGESNKRFLLVVDLNHCRSIYYRHQLPDSVLCASTCDNGSRFLSGSALMGVNATRTRATHYYFIGMLTFGRTECVDYAPDIFQRIDDHVDWIKRTIQRI